MHVLREHPFVLMEMKSVNPDIQPLKLELHYAISFTYKLTYSLCEGFNHQTKNWQNAHMKRAHYHHSTTRPYVNNSKV